VHELSIAMSIVELAQEESKRLGAERVEAVHLRVGALAGIVKDSLLFSYEMAAQDTELAGSRLVIEDVPGVVHCARCNAERPIESAQSCCCAECGTPALDVVSGRELQVTALEVWP
jgi:hydrogenase nickel incorporation protein HypA/HybF